MQLPTSALKGRREDEDKDLIVEFTLEAVESSMKTEQAGHPVYDDCEFVKIVVPADPRNIIFTHATKEHIKRFPDEYKAFKENASLPVTGTPIEHWAHLTKGQVAQFKALEIRTVEQLANLSDANAGAIMGYHDLRRKAQAYLKTAQDASALAKQEAAFEDLRKLLAEQATQIASLQAEKKNDKKAVKEAA